MHAAEATRQMDLVLCRYKLWMFLGNGGHVGLAAYHPRHWREHEVSKKDQALTGELDDGAGERFNGVEGLFEQVG